MSDEIQTAVEPGQVWCPTKRGAYPKIVTRISKRGGIYALRHPRVFSALPTCFTRAAWNAWVSKYDAKPSKDVANAE